MNKMVRFNSDQMQAAMQKRNNIRNISIIAHIDSGNFLDYILTIVNFNFKK